MGNTDYWPVTPAAGGVFSGLLEAVNSKLNFEEYMGDFWVNQACEKLLYIGI